VVFEDGCPARVPLMTPADAGWLAGIIDGEGTITLTRTYTSKDHDFRKPIISVASCDVEMLEKMKRVANINSAIVPKRTYAKGHAPSFSLRVNGTNHVIEVLEEVLPHMTIPHKIGRAKLIVSGWKEVVHPGGRYTEETLERRLQLQDEIMSIKQGKRWVPSSRKDG
jgi:hypothetical protein